MKPATGNVSVLTTVLHKRVARLEDKLLETSTKHRNCANWKMLKRCQIHDQSPSPRPSNDTVKSKYDTKHPKNNHGTILSVLAWIHNQVNMQVYIAVPFRFRANERYFTALPFYHRPN